MINRPLAISTTVCLACLLFLCGCSVFETKNPEAPFIGGTAEDPLNIGDILRVANESAAYMDYRDYFTESVIFTDYGLRQMSGRDNLIRMLERLRMQATHVEWQVERSDKFVEGNHQILKNVPYVVTSGAKEICRGLADFRIVREPEWRISEWKDVPDAQHTPFFELP